LAARPLLAQHDRATPIETHDVKRVLARRSAAPSTAYVYDWNLLPIGQRLWLQWFETLQAFPPMQSPASYNLTQVMDQIKNNKNHPSD
jgi:hypothetical protein